MKRWLLLLLLLCGCRSIDRSNPPVEESEAGIVIRNKELIYGDRYWEK